MVAPAPADPCPGASERNPKMSDSLTGGCLCGAIRYTVSAPVDRLIACYCTDCQHVSGTGASINAVVPAAAFRIDHGTPKVFSKPADSGRLLNRHFCGDCGCPLYSQHSPEAIVLKVGGLDRPVEGMRVVTNIWMRSRPAWAPIDDSVPAFEGNRPAAGR